MSNAGQAVLTIGGAIVGGIIGGVPGAQLGYLLGGAAGQAFFPTELPTVRGPKLDNLQIQVSTIGAPIPHSWGRFGQAGNVIWSSGLLPTTTKKKQGGKGFGGPTQTVEETTYTIDVAVGGPAGVQAGIRRLWADAICIYDKRPQVYDESDEAFAKRLAATAALDEILVVYLGTQTQLPDPTIESYVGVGNCLAYRGLAYFVLTGFDCEPWGKRLPNLVAEWYTEGTVNDEDCSAYSAGQLEPWQFQLTSGVHDPRNPDNNHLYGYTEGGGAANTTFAAALAAMNAASDHPDVPFLAGATPQAGDSLYIHGWSTSTTPNEIAPCDTTGSAAIADYVGIQMTLDVVRILAGGDACADDIAGNNCTDWWAFLGDKGTPKYVSAGQFSGVVVAVEVGADPSVYLEGLPASSADTDLVFSGCNVGGETFDLWRSQSHELAVTRTIQPPSGCQGGSEIPTAPGYCVIDGVVTQAVTWTLVSGTFKVLQPYQTSGNVVTTYPVNPCLPLGDADYNNQAFWEAGYAADQASASPKMAGGLTYGVDYPTVVSSAYQASCEGETVDTPCVSVASIVEDICLRCGLRADQIDVTDLTSCVEGYIVPQPMSGRDMIAPLMAFGLFDAVESQGVLKFVERGHAHVATLTTDDLAAHGAGQPRPSVVVTKRLLEEQLPRTLRLQYASPERDYEIGEAKASRATVLATDDVTIRLPIAMSDERAAQLVEILLYNQWVARTTYDAVTTRARLALEPTDNILLPVDGFQERMRIVESTYATAGILRLSMVRDHVDSYTSTAVPATPAGSGTGAGGGAGSTLVCPAEGILLDIPGLRTQDDDCGVYFVARSQCDNYNGADLYRSSDGGDSYDWVGHAAHEGTIGTVRAVDIDGNSPDTLEILLESGGPLESVTEAQLDVGLNLAAVGADGRWCILQFDVATVDSGDVWVLQIARSGLMGSAAHCDALTVGDRFVLLSESDLVRIDEVPAAAGVTKRYKVVATGEPVDAVESFDFTTECLSYVAPAAPVHVISCTTSTPPDDPSDGDAYLVPADTGATGAWTGHEGQICTFKNIAGWSCVDPPVGVPIYCDDAGDYVTPDASGGFTGAPWTPAIPPLAEIDSSGDLASAYFVVFVDGQYRKVLGTATGGGNSTATYVTGTDETADLPNSLQLLGDDGIIVDVNASTNTVVVRLDTTPGGIPGGIMQFLGSAVVTGAAATNLTFSGLDLATDGAYFVTYCLDNASVSTTAYRLFYNADTTTTNYDSEVTGANGGTTGSAGANNPEFATGIPTGFNITGHFLIQHNFDGKGGAVGHHHGIETTVRFQQMWAQQHRSAANVTAFTISSSVASALSIGSRISVWKVPLS